MERRGVKIMGRKEVLQRAEQKAEEEKRAEEPILITFKVEEKEIGRAILRQYIEKYTFLRGIVPFQTPVEGYECVYKISRGAMEKAKADLKEAEVEYLYYVPRLRTREEFYNPENWYKPSSQDATKELDYDPALAPRLARMKELSVKEAEANGIKVDRRSNLQRYEDRLWGLSKSDK